MKAYEALGWWLLNATAVTNITSTRIYHGLRPQGDSDLPVINYYELGAGKVSGGIKSQPFSVNCRDKTPAGARDLAEEVEITLTGSARTGMYGTGNGFDVARSSLQADQGLIQEQDGDLFNAPIDIILVYDLSTVS